MLWLRCRPLLLLHQLLSLLLLPLSWIALLPNWTSCGKIFWAPTLAWWPGAWSWLLAGFALTLRFEQLVQASTACDEEKQAVLGAKAARDAALGEVANV